jgi:microcin C transport system substrate-binding protein
MAPRLSRRQVLGLGLGALSAARLRRAAANNEGGKLHGLSAFGELKYWRPYAL